MHACFLSNIPVQLCCCHGDVVCKVFVCVLSCLVHFLWSYQDLVQLELPDWLRAWHWICTIQLTCCPHGLSHSMHTPTGGRSSSNDYVKLS